MKIGKISKKGQISIPINIRKQFNLQPGDAISFMVQGEKIILVKIGEVSTQKLSDILLGCDPLEESSIEYQRKLRDEWK